AGGDGRRPGAVSRASSRQLDREGRQAGGLGPDRPELFRSQELLEPALGNQPDALQRRLIRRLQPGTPQPRADGRRQVPHRSAACRRPRQHRAGAGGSGHCFSQRPGPAHQPARRALSGRPGGERPGHVCRQGPGAGRSAYATAAAGLSRRAVCERSAAESRARCVALSHWLQSRMGGNIDSRPDPDQLLEQIRGEEERARKGRLRIYFGATAGVGKTYAMLSAAQREHKVGVDVVVGVLETHGRDETAEMLVGLQQLPLREVPYRGRVLKEFDLDAALARKPRVLLVDELAHSNVAGSRHPKRWQDVSELLEAGIDVWSTLNVQHLESLNGTIGAITGIRVHETVPDTVLDEADEVILIDVTPDELIARMKAGKVYLPQQAERAAQNFFRKGNLIALREIALRRTAEHVEDDVRSYRVEQSISPVWNTEGALLACIGPREGAEQTVRAAARLAGQLNVRWYAAYVETPSLQRASNEQRDRILAVIKLAADLGAQTAVLTGSDVAAELIRQAQAQNCAMLVIGRSRSSRWAWTQPGITQRLATLAPGLNTLEIGQSESVRRLSQLVQPAHDEEARAEWQQSWPRYAAAV